jgi:serine protease inhibitor
VVYFIKKIILQADVNITLPKFKLESTTNLVQPLKKMGIQTLFSPQAELPYLSNYNSVQVSNAEQQASIDVNEEGTVVISFTNLNVVALSFTPPVPSVDFLVNRPFLAVVANRNRNIPYVIAKITNPTH